MKKLTPKKLTLKKTALKVLAKDPRVAAGYFGLPTNGLFNCATFHPCWLLP